MKFPQNLSILHLIERDTYIAMLKRFFFNSKGHNASMCG